MTYDFKQLLNISLRILSLRPRSEKEITSRLQKYTSDPKLINQVLDQLKSIKLLDDAKFAAWLIDSRSRTRPRGRRLLEHELKLKGISPADFELSAVDEKALAFQALQKKHQTWSQLSTTDYQLKARRYLAARGFSWTTIAAVLKTGYNESDVT